MELNIRKTNGYHFCIENNALVIKRQISFSDKIINRIECEHIIKLESRDPYREFAWYKKILFVVLQIITSATSRMGKGISIWEKRLCILHSVDGEIIKDCFNLTLNKTEFSTLKKAIQAVLNKENTIL